MSVQVYITTGSKLNAFFEQVLPQAEAVLPIAATGSFGRIDGFPFLQMIDRKVKWIFANMDALIGALEQ